MERQIFSDLVKWKNDARRKPLLLLGVRQCGKTWALLEFGRRHYENVVHFDFAGNPEYKEFFETTRDPLRILERLRLMKGRIESRNTLLIFDEIQECPEALTALKYFFERLPEYHIACAGSLLGVRLAQGTSFPVGKVDFLYMRPMSFSEFLVADEDAGTDEHKGVELAAYIKQLDRIEPIPDAFFSHLVEKLNVYFSVGGMPEAVRVWTESRDSDKVEKALSAILSSFNFDFSKHLPPAESQKVSLVLRSLPTQLAKENKKFVYRLVKDNARAREYEPAIGWLADADLIYKVNRVGAPGLPLSAYEDLSAFKLYAADIGLLRKLAPLDAQTLALGHRFFTAFKGSFSENHVLAALAGKHQTPLRYWSVNNPAYEVDFMMQYKNDIFPIEVKAAANTKSRGLKAFRDRYGEKINLSLRFSLHNFHLQDGILNIPLFLADRTTEFIDMV